MNTIAQGLMKAGVLAEITVLRIQVEDKLRSCRGIGEFWRLVQDILVNHPVLAPSVYRTASSLWYTKDKTMVNSLKILKNSLKEVPEGKQSKFVQDFFMNTGRYTAR